MNILALCFRHFSGKVSGPIARPSSKDEHEHSGRIRSIRPEHGMPECGRLTRPGEKAGGSEKGRVKTRVKTNERPDSFELGRPGSPPPELLTPEITDYPAF